MSINPIAGRPDIYDRDADKKFDKLLFAEGTYLQGADLNEMASQLRRQQEAFANLVAKPGDRLAGADVIVTAPGTVLCTAGTVFLRGQPRDVSQRILTGVPMLGDIDIGIYSTDVIVTHAEDPDLLGLHAGSDAEGEPGAVRVRLTFQWGRRDDGTAGSFFRYITLRDGAPITTQAPPELSGFIPIIAEYDFDANGNYTPEGCEVMAEDLSGNDQVFTVGSGKVNVKGRKTRRPVGTRHTRAQDPSLATIAAEPHIWNNSGDGTALITVRRPPIAGVLSAVVEKQETASIAKGVTNSTDALPKAGVTAIVSVVQGGTTYVAGTSYTQSGDGVSWAPGGAEPASGSTYQVTYKYLEAVTPQAITARTMKLPSGIAGGQIIVSYTWKRPRIDKLCIDEFGNVVFLNGEPADQNPISPTVPEGIHALATITNDWFGKPVVKNDGVPNIPFSTQLRLFEQMRRSIDEIGLLKGQIQANARAPGAINGIFADPLTSNFYRDLGATNTAAVFDGILTLPITASFRTIRASAPITLSWTDQIVIEQPFHTACEKINPYMNFSPPALRMGIVPSRDFWTEREDLPVSEITRIVGAGANSRIIQTETSESIEDIPIRFLRSIVVAFTIEGFGSGEILSSLTFDGVPVVPNSVVNTSGTVTGWFTIPARISSGRKEVLAIGGSGRDAAATFEGRGAIERRNRTVTTTFERFDPPRPIPQPDLIPEALDPQAQSFVFPGGGHVAAVQLKFCAIGNRSNAVILEIVTVENGVPTTDVIAQTEVNMVSVIAGQWVRFSFPTPVYLPGGTYFAFVVKTDDAFHAVQIADLGGFDAARQEFVISQPYTVGDRFSSSNAVSWLVHPNSDITFRLIGALFNPTQRIVDLGSVSVASCTDILVDANVFLPTQDCRALFELTFGSEPPIFLQAGQAWARTNSYTGSVRVRAVLNGSATASPIIQPDILIVVGTIATSAIYTSRRFAHGTAVRMQAAMSALLPSGSTVTVEIEDGSGSWQTMSLDRSTPIDLGFIEQEYIRSAHTAVNGARLRVIITGSAAARLAIADLRSSSSIPV